MAAVLTQTGLRARVVVLQKESPTREVPVDQITAGFPGREFAVLELIGKLMGIGALVCTGVDDRGHILIRLGRLVFL